MKPNLLKAGKATESVTNEKADKEIAYLSTDTDQFKTDAQNIAVLWDEIGNYPKTFYPIIKEIKAKYNVFERYELKMRVSKIYTQNANINCRSN